MDSLSGHLTPLLFVILNSLSLRIQTQRWSYRNLIAGPVDLVECTRVHRPTEEARRRCPSQNGPEIPHKKMDMGTPPDTNLHATSRLQRSHMCTEERPGIQSTPDVQSTPDIRSMYERARKEKRNSPPKNLAAAHGHTGHIIAGNETWARTYVVLGIQFDVNVDQGARTIVRQGEPKMKIVCWRREHSVQSAWAKLLLPFVWTKKDW